MSIQTKPIDFTQFLTSPEAIEAYLGDAFESGDVRVISAALGDVARAKGMSEVANLTGAGRESLYKSLSENGRPSLETVLKVMGALGLSLTPRRSAA